MLFSSIPGLSDIKEKLIGAIQSNHLAHALLLHGPEGSANLAMALALATYINCANRGQEDACGACGSCQKMAKLIHPDVGFTFPVPGTQSKEEGKEEDNQSGNILTPWRTFALQYPYGNLVDWISHNGFTKQLNISKAASKQIIQTLSLKSFEGGYKIILIWSPEMMHTAAANALLKVLEEPPTKTLFLLVSNQPDQLINTILSRTQKILVRGFTDEEIREHLVTEGFCTGEAALQIAPLADGSLREAYRLVEQVQDENTSKFRDWMRICYNLDLNGIVSQVDEFSEQDKEAQKTLILTGLNTLRESLLKKSQLDALMRTAPPDRKFIEDFGKNVLTEEKIISMYQLLNDAHYHLERNASAKILFADLSFNAARVLRKKS
jgi:DNA polymerase-3 subunit delta'